MEKLEDHLKDGDKIVKDMAVDVKNLKEVVFGNEEIKEKGIKEKVDEMHNILIGLKGVKGLFGLVIMLGIFIATIKGWFFK